jgi:hypothetical protein
MALTEFKIESASRGEIGVVHVSHYRKWGSGNMFERPPYSMTQNESDLNRTVTVDSRGAHLIAAVHVPDPAGKYYQWRQRLQITNQDGVLVDVGDYLLPGGKPKPKASPRRFDWDFDRQDERQECQRLLNTSLSFKTTRINPLIYSPTLVHSKHSERSRSIPSPG